MASGTTGTAIDKAQIREAISPAIKPSAASRSAPSNHAAGLLLITLERNEPAQLTVTRMTGKANARSGGAVINGHGRKVKDKVLPYGHQALQALKDGTPHLLG